MDLERTRNSKRNILFAIIQKSVDILGPFLFRTCVIYYLGNLYLGLNSLFSSILSVLSLVELGFGSAMVFNMYEPIARDDDISICSLLYFYRRIYLYIGSAIAVLGIAIIPFLPVLIKEDIPKEINVYIIYIITLLSVVISYFAGAYRSSILYAYQRNDVISKIQTIINLIKYASQIIIVIFLQNYYFCLLVVVFTNLASNLVVALFTKKMYSNLSPRGSLEKELKEKVFLKVKSLFLYKVGGVVSNSADNIIISSFLGVNLLAKYSNYYYVISMLFGFLIMLYQSIIAGVGNKMVVESREKIYGLFKKLNFMQSWIIGWITICLICLYQDFISYWVGEEWIFDFGMVILLALYFYTWKINDMVYTFKDAKGMWEYDKLRPLLSSIANLIVNIILCKIIGIYGVVISTILCELTFSLFWGVKTFFDHFFRGKFKEYLIDTAKNSIVFILIGVFTYNVIKYVDVENNLLKIVLKGIVCLIIPNIIFILINIKNDNLRWLFKKIIRR